MEDIAIKVDNVSKTFKLPREKNTSIKSAAINIFRARKGYDLQRALDDVSFEIKKGEFFGIVGKNGSGKSTLLKLLAGIYTPTKGSIQVNGKLTPFIELGVGFNAELTGRENVYLNGALLGFSRKEMQAMYKDIVEFAELKRFMDQKLKNYSSGMQVRLAFSIAIRAQSDILLIDEVLAVGDAAFQTKCYNYFYELKKKNTTVVFVSHDRGALERFCENGVLINDGEVVSSGPIQDVLKDYTSIVLDQLDSTQIKPAQNKDRKTSDYAKITNIEALDAKNQPKNKFNFGDEISVRFEIQVKHSMTNPVIGMTLWHKNTDTALFATNTLIESKSAGEYSKGDKIIFTSKLPRIINDGEYSIEPAIANDSATVFYDQVPGGTSFFVSGGNNPHSLLSDTSGSIIIEKKTRQYGED